MNALEVLAGLDWWTVAGWTMLHYLWLGLAVGVAAGASRLVLRRASAQVRYVVAVTWLAVLALLPVGVGIGVGCRVSGVREAARSETSIDEHVVNSAPTAAPGSAGAIVDLARSERPMETKLADQSSQPLIANTDANPRQSRGLTAATEWSPYLEMAAGWLPWVWIVGAPVTFLLLATGVVGAERLRQESRLVVDGPVVECLERLRGSLAIGRRVAVAVCERVAAPVLMGIVQPMILLPPAALTGWSPEEIEMVLLHELAHMRRWDNFVNLVQRLVEAALFFQPAVWLVSGWVRREREACCDAVVVGRTQRPQAYAELLVALAAQLPRSVLFHPTAASAMAAGPLRGRIRRVLGIEDDPMLVSGKSLGIVVSTLLLAATLVVLNRPARSEAEQQTELTTEDTEKKSERELPSAELESVDSIFSEAVPFVVGASRFADGDRITITSVSGPTTKFMPGGTYWIDGTYTLGSRDKASLSAFVTARNAGEGRSSIKKGQTMIVERGSGTFTLELRMPYEGWPHVSFYPAEGGQSFGGVYFGTGDTVLTKWWREKDRTTEGTEDTEATETVERRRVGVGGNLPVEVSEEDERRIVAEVLRNPAVRSASIQRAPNDLQMLVTSVVTPPGKKAFLMWKTDSQGRLTCSIEFAVPPKLTEKTQATGRERVELAPATVDDEGASPPSDNENRRVTLDINENRTATAESEPGRLRLQIRTTESQQGKFPTLEEQKLADIVYRFMGLELEPLAANDLQRVQALGYGGGMKVSQNDGRVISWETDRGGIQPTDILVGLHVWPTTGLQEVADVLERDDLAELSPLKFYVVRPDGNPGMTKEPPPDKVFTGRISVSSGGFAASDARRSRNRQASGNAYEPIPIPPLSEQEKDKLRERGPLRLQFYYAPDSEPCRRGLVRLAEIQAAFGDLVQIERINVMEQAALAVNQQIQVVPTTILFWGDKPKGKASGVFTIAELEEMLAGLARASATANHTLQSEEVGKSKLDPRPRVVEATPQPIPLGSMKKSEPATPKDRLLDEVLAADPNLEMMQQELMSLEYQLNAKAGRTKSDGSKELDRLKLQIAAMRNGIAVYRSQIQEHLASANQLKSTLRYDGKTFDEWRAAWRTELSTEKRIEAVKALAAFGANGYGKEAAEAIVEVAGQYDWKNNLPASEENIKRGCMSALGADFGTVSTYRVPAKDALPALLRAADSQNVNSRLLAAWVLPYYLEDQRTNDTLAKLRDDPDAAVRSFAFQVSSPKTPRASLDSFSVNRGMPSQVFQDLLSNDSQTVRVAIRSLVKDADWYRGQGIAMEQDGPVLYFDWKLFPLLFSPDEGVRKEARQALRYLRDSDSHIVAQLEDFLSVEARRTDRLESIRALAALGPKASPAMGRLKQLLASDDPEMRIAAAAAIKMIVGKDQYQQPVTEVLGEELGIEAVKTTEGAWGAVPRKDAKDDGQAFGEFTDAVIKEQQRLFPGGNF